MSDNQENQSAMTSSTRHRRRDSTNLECGYSKYIRVHLTNGSGEGLQEARDNECDDWKDFWSKLISDEEWRLRTSNMLCVLPISFHTRREHPVLMLTPDFETPPNTSDKAEQSTKKAKEILRNLGFVEYSGCRLHGNPDCRRHGLCMKWGYPDRGWVERTMPRFMLVKDGKVEYPPGKLSCADVEWIDYIHWERFDIPVRKAKRNWQTLEAVDGQWEEPVGKRAKLEDA
ncbi:hypothetical protein B0H65DRAFT_572054 [Neurospora tetraspora]|uniref:Uncharacterized protein n=1 Tax=Neurospora tetraspora TaxID=94610 RepID=A0AAE0JIC1_9PEZI|nr:hypothetical protein B0H65DRAFT_572054 [Neurospora tetraspora]